MNVVYEPRVTIIPPKKASEAERLLKKLNVAAYARVSTDEEEQETSYEAQISYYTEKITSNPEWKMAGIFADEGITGTQAKKRPEFLKMIELCRKKKIDLILTKSVSRFARNTVDCLNYVRELKAVGIGIIFEKENINTLLVENEMLLTIMSCFAQAESESISQNVSWGVRQSFKGGNVPMKYKMLMGYCEGVDGQPEVVPEEAEIVKEIFRQYLDGKSYRQIADELNSRGILSKYKNRPWSVGNIKQILLNEKYTGDALLQKTYTVDCISKKRRKNNGELPMYLIRNHHEPIISHEEFNRAQEEMARRNSIRNLSGSASGTENSKYSAKYALTERMICGECGSRYRRVVWTKNGRKTAKWRCTNRLTNGVKCCHSPTVDEKTLHKALVEVINVFCDVKDEVAEKLRESVAESLNPNQNQSVIAAKRKIEELSRNIDELIELASKADTSETVLENIQRYSNEMKDLRSFIEREKAKQASVECNNRQIKSILDKIQNEDFKLKEYDDIAVRQLVECVKVIDKGTIEVMFRGGAVVRKNL